MSSSIENVAPNKTAVPAVSPIESLSGISGADSDKVDDQHSGAWSAAGISSASVSSNNSELPSSVRSATGISPVSSSSTTADSKSSVSVLMQSSAATSSNISSPDLNARISDASLHRALLSSPISSSSSIATESSSKADSTSTATDAHDGSAKKNLIPTVKELKSGIGASTDEGCALPADSMILVMPNNPSLASSDSTEMKNVPMRNNRSVMQPIVEDSDEERRISIEGGLFADRVDVNLGEGVIRRSSGVFEDPPSPEVSDVVSDASDKALVFSTSTISSLSYHFNRVVRLDDDVSIGSLGGCGTIRSESDTVSDPISNRFEEPHGSDLEQSAGAGEEAASQEHAQD